MKLGNKNEGERDSSFEFPAERRNLVPAFMGDENKLNMGKVL